MLARLRARNFRNLEPLVFSPASGSHLLLGGTGTGKTSLLEAIYVVATTRSFRTSQLEDCLRRADGANGEESFHLEAETGGDERVRLEVGYSREGGSWRRRNGRQEPLAAHLAALPVLAWTSGDGEILVGSPERRRRFLDRGIVGQRPGAVDLLSRYRRILRAKRELLLRRQKGLESWNELQAEAAAELVTARRRHVEGLTANLDRVLIASGLGLPQVELAYEPSPREGDGGAGAIGAVLARLARKERDVGRPLVGPHRDRLRITLGGVEVQRLASAGERKALGLLLLAAQAAVWREAGRSALLLLDDADTELDRATLASVWGVLGTAPQVLVSSNRPEVWEGLQVGHRWRLGGGLLESL